MAIQTQYTPDRYTGDGSLDTFAFNWRILAKTDVLALMDNAGTVTTLTLNTDYTIADDDVGVAGGGDVVLTDPLPDGAVLVLKRYTARTQLVQIDEGSPFPASVVNKVFDRLTMMIQELTYTDRISLQYPPTSDIVDSPLPEPEAGALLQWNSDEDGLQNVHASSLELTHTIITQAVAAGAFEATITHNLASASANMIGFTPTWGTGFRLVSQDVNSITIEFTVEAPTGGGSITTEVAI